MYEDKCNKSENKFEERKHISVYGKVDTKHFLLILLWTVINSLVQSFIIRAKLKWNPSNYKHTLNCRIGPFHTNFRVRDIIIVEDPTVTVKCWTAIQEMFLLL